MAHFQTNWAGSGSLRRNVGRHFASAGILCEYLFAMAIMAFPQTNAARIFKIVYSEGQPADSVTMFSSRTNLASRESILGYLTNATTRLTERDVVILQAEPSVPGRSLVRFCRELCLACNTSGAQLCNFHHSDNKEVHLNYDLKFFAEEEKGV